MCHRRLPEATSELSLEDQVGHTVFSARDMVHVQRAEGELDDSDTCEWLSEGSWQSGRIEVGKAGGKRVDGPERLC